MAQHDFLHQRGESVVFNGRSQGDACVHGEIPHRATKTEAVDEVKGYRHVDRIDGHDLVVHLAIVHVAIGEADLVGVHVERHHWSVVNYICGIDDFDERTIVRVPNGSRGCKRGRKFVTWRARNNLPFRLKVNRARVKYDISIGIEVSRSGRVRRESEFGGEIQTQLGSDIGIVNIGQDVPDIFSTSLQMAQIERYGNGPVRNVKHAGIQ